MGKTEKYLLLAAAAAGVYFFVLKPSQPQQLALVAYDGSNQAINVDGNMSAAGIQQIRNFFAKGGTMQMSTNPAQDEAALVASLKAQGYTIAAASCDSLYRTLLVNAQLTSQSTQTQGYDAGAPFGIRIHRNPPHYAPRG